MLLLCLCHYFWQYEACSNLLLRARQKMQERLAAKLCVGAVLLVCEYLYNTLRVNAPALA